MRLLIGHVGDGAYDNKRDVEIVADMGDCRRFHLPSKDGKYSLYCAVIVKKVDAKTRGKVGINELLRTID